MSSSGGNSLGYTPENKMLSNTSITQTPTTTVTAVTRYLAMLQPPFNSLFITMGVGGLPQGDLVVTPVTIGVL